MQLSCNNVHLMYCSTVLIHPYYCRQGLYRLAILIQEFSGSKFKSRPMHKEFEDKWYFPWYFPVRNTHNYQQ